jgi:hypothetical protein
MGIDVEEADMRKRVAVVGVFVAALSLVPFGAGSVASACPDPDNPCDLEPQPAPPLWCKLTPFC